MSQETIVLVSDSYEAGREMARLLTRLGYRLRRIDRQGSLAAVLRLERPLAVVLAHGRRESDVILHALQVLWLDQSQSRLPVLLCSDMHEAWDDLRQRLERRGCMLSALPTSEASLQRLLHEVVNASLAA